MSCIRCSFSGPCRAVALMKGRSACRPPASLSGPARHVRSENRSTFFSVTTFTGTLISLSDFVALDASHRVPHGDLAQLRGLLGHGGVQRALLDGLQAVRGAVEADDLDVDLPALEPSALIAPSAISSFSAKTPLMSGWAWSRLVMTSRPLVRSKSAGCLATTLMPGYVLRPSAKPWPRSRVAEVPAWPWRTTILPLPPSCSASALGGQLAARDVVGGDECVATSALLTPRSAAMTGMSPCWRP